MSELIPIRLSHLLRHCSVGSVVRGPDYLMTVKDIREWTDRHGNLAARTIPYVERVCDALGIEKQLREPPIARELGNGTVDGVCIPAQRFPSWMRCPNPLCGFMYHKPWKYDKENIKPICTDNKCKQHPELEQVQWILVHANGHMADVPWHYLTHRYAKKPEQIGCKEKHDKSYIRLLEGPQWKLFCETCGSTSIFLENSQMPFPNSYPEQPWLRTVPDAKALCKTNVGNGKENDEQIFAMVISVNDTRIHYPDTESALVIPPESRIRKGSVIDILYSSSEKLKKIGQARFPLDKKSAIQTLATELRCTKHDIEHAWLEIQKGYPLYGVSITLGQLKESEYQAFTEEIADVCEDEDFVTKHRTRDWKLLLSNHVLGPKSVRIIKLVSSLVEVTRLKEILVFKGFRRVASEGGSLVPPDIVGESDWLPAIELYGEGIFFTLDHELIQQWENDPLIQARVDVFQSRLEQSKLRFDPGRNVTARFVLLHTIAHIVIRQLEISAGYPAASLKERIYFSSDKEPMSGILIYVAVPDVVGSLGGVAELAEPNRFLSLLTGVFDHAEWCSLDPVCSEHEGQGPELLNRAACHACSLIPEPSCAYGNALLDRTFIKGDIAGKIPAVLEWIDPVE